MLGESPTRGSDGAPVVTAFERGEWMQYTIDAAAAGPRTARLIVAADGPAILSLSVNDGAPLAVPVQPGAGWQAVPAPPLTILEGVNRLRVGVTSGNVRLKAIRF